MFRYLFVIFLILFSFLLPKVVAKTEITLSVDNYPPYIDGRQSNKGKLAKIVTDIFKLQGYNVKYKFMSWPETEIAITDGNSFSFMWYKSEKRTKPNVATTKQKHLFDNKTIWMLNRKSKP